MPAPLPSPSTSARHAASRPANGADHDHSPAEHPAWCTPLGCNAGAVHVEDVRHVGEPLYHHVDDGDVELALARCQYSDDEPVYLFAVRRTATTWVGEMPLTDADIDWIIEARARIRSEDIHRSDAQDAPASDA